MNETIGAKGETAAKSRKLWARALDQFRQLLVMFIYLWVLFGLFVLNERVILDEHGMALAMNGFAFVNAFVLAKVMLVVEELNLARWLEERPLIFPILFESFLLAVLFIVFHVVEHTVVGMIGGSTLRASVPAIGGGGLLGVACVALMLFVSLIPFFAFKHLSRALGVERVKHLLFNVPQHPPSH